MVLIKENSITEYLGISRSLLRRLRRETNIPIRYEGKVMVANTDELDDWGRKYPNQWQFWVGREDLK